MADGGVVVAEFVQNTGTTLSWTLPFDIQLLAITSNFTEGTAGFTGKLMQVWIGTQVPTVAVGAFVDQVRILAIYQSRIQHQLGFQANVGDIVNIQNATDATSVTHLMYQLI